ncbi:MAG: Spy/CpxP family protein refolding chaperone [Planctomycetaceae bacterium]
MKRVKLFTLAAALMAMLIVPAVQAQPGGGGRPGGGQFGGRPGGGQFGGRGGGPNNISISQLLQSEKVRNEAEIFDEQVQELKEASDKIRADARANQGERPDFRNLTEEQRRELFEKFRKSSEETQKKINSAVQEILLPHQLERLEEIRIQILGSGALLLEPVQKKLKVTDTQKAKFEEITNGTREKSQEMFGSVREKFQELGGDREKIQALMAEIREKMEAVQKEAEEKIVGTLTAGQKKQFEEMKGKPFEISREDLRPQRPQGQRPGGQGGQRPGGQNGQRPQGQPGQRPSL